jgi:hypothetical protein
VPLLLVLNRFFGFEGIIWAQPVTEVIMMAVSVSLLCQTILSEEKQGILCGYNEYGNERNAEETDPRI